MTSNATNALFDANVWVALVLRTHMHNAAAIAALPNLPVPAVCRVTQTTLLRMLTNPTVMGGNVCDAATAWSAYERIVEHTGAQFSPEPAGLDRQWKAYACAHPIASANNWTDTYLAAFAQCAGLQLVTFDKGFRRFSGLDCRLL